MAAHFLLALLLFPTILAEPVNFRRDPINIPISRRSLLTSSGRLDINAEAKRLRTKYRRPVSDSSTQSNKRAVAGVTIFDQVFFDIVIFFVSYELTTRIGWRC